MVNIDLSDDAICLYTIEYTPFFVCAFILCTTDVAPVVDTVSDYSVIYPALDMWASEKILSTD
jgi:hypothetical protein